MQIERELLTPIQSGLTISQAADLLGVSKDTLRRWEKNGLISPSRTAGRLRRYSWEDLRAARFQSGRRLYRMSQLLQNFKSNKQTIQTIVLTSLIWVVGIALYAFLAPKFLAPTNPDQQILSVLPSSSTPGVDLASDLLIRHSSGTTILQYSDKPEQYFLLQPLPKNPIPTLIKRN